MFRRGLELPSERSFFLFGARGTGKSTLLKERFPDNNVLWVDLLIPEQEDLYARNPSRLMQQVEAMRRSASLVVIDEIQKVPALLDVVQNLMSQKNLRFALTGSSARKLKRGSANLLAGRASVAHLFPLMGSELGSAFNLEDALSFGTLPELWASALAESERSEFLRAYAHTYLKEEVWAEHLIRKLEPFRRFLEIAAQQNGEILNYARIGDDVGVDPKTVETYFDILVDTLVGFYLPAYHRSVRKQQRQAPKFFFFDTGVVRALTRTLTQKPVEGTYGFGKLFEHWVILEMQRHIAYQQPDWVLSYLRTKDQAEIEVVIDRPGMPVALVEIKSSSRVSERDLTTLERFLPALSPASAYCLCREPSARKVGSVLVLPWQQGLLDLGLGPA